MTKNLFYSAKPMVLVNVIRYRTVLKHHDFMYKFTFYCECVIFYFHLWKIFFFLD